MENKRVGLFKDQLRDRSCLSVSPQHSEWRQLPVFGNESLGSFFPGRGRGWGGRTASALRLPSDLPECRFSGHSPTSLPALRDLGAAPRKRVGAAAGAGVPGGRG